MTDKIPPFIIVHCEELCADPANAGIIEDALEIIFSDPLGKEIMALRAQEEKRLNTNRPIHFISAENGFSQLCVIPSNMLEYSMERLKYDRFTDQELAQMRDLVDDKGITFVINMNHTELKPKSDLEALAEMAGLSKEEMECYEPNYLRKNLVFMQDARFNVAHELLHAVNYMHILEITYYQQLINQRQNQQDNQDDVFPVSDPLSVENTKKIYRELREQLMKYPEILDESVWFFADTYQDFITRMDREITQKSSFGEVDYIFLSQMAEELTVQKENEFRVRQGSVFMRQSYGLVEPPSDLWEQAKEAGQALCLSTSESPAGNPEISHEPTPPAARHGRGAAI